jgi:tryptophan 2,3-dioxygenase
VSFALVPRLFTGSPARIAMIAHERIRLFVDIRHSSIPPARYRKHPMSPYLRHMPDFSPEIHDKLRKLEAKFAAMGQDMNSYLEGLLHADYLKYWDYINLDTLLSLQQPRTGFPDEKTFIIYHQITELYFRLILNQLEELTAQKPTKELFLKHIPRINRYIVHLTDSFAIMMEGMEKEQFLAFRMSLLPASGFQSAQYRFIEIRCTDAINLVAADKREQVQNASLQEQYDNFYWKRGGIELATGNKTLTLRQFEEKYTSDFLELLDGCRDTNVWRRFQQLSDTERNDPELLALMRTFDHTLEVRWPLVHYKTAARYLDQKPEVIAATGGTNWQKYLPPHHQMIQLFPSLWSEEETRDWGVRDRLVEEKG